MPGCYWSISLVALHTGSVHKFCNRSGCEARMMDAIFLTHFGSPDFVEIIEEMQASVNVVERSTKAY